MMLSRTGWDSNPRYAVDVNTLSKLENIGRDSDKMSSFTYDGPRNVLCSPVPMSGDVRRQSTARPTPVNGVYHFRTRISLRGTGTSRTTVTGSCRPRAAVAEIAER